MGSVRLHEIAQPEIDQLDGAVIFITYEKNIFGLEIAMNDFIPREDFETLQNRMSEFTHQLKTKPLEMCVKNL